VTALRHRLKSFVWVALLAICGVALGPTISRTLGLAMVHAGDAAGQRMDTGAHAAMVGMDHRAHMAHMASAARQAPAEDPSNGPGHSSCVLDCCALCAVAASPFTSVALFVPVWSAAESVATAPADRSRARPDQRAPWPRAAPRGPPATT